MSRNRTLASTLEGKTAPPSLSVPPTQAMRSGCTAEWRMKGDSDTGMSSILV